MAARCSASLTVLLFGMFCGVVSADHAIVTGRAGTTQSGSAGVTFVLGGPICFLGNCSGSAGVAGEAEVGIGGLKAALGLGLADRGDGERFLMAGKVAVVRGWTRGCGMLPDGAVFAGPEFDVAGRWGASAGVFKRLGGPGWRVSVAVLRSF